mgnify:CR=1 FL=1
MNKIVTDDKGNGSLGNLPLGIYYVKETKASQGYILDKTVYTVDISKGNNAVVEKTVTSKETPLLDPTAILLKKSRFRNRTRNTTRRCFFRRCTIPSKILSCCYGH